MKKYLIFGLFFLFGVTTLMGGAILVMDYMRKNDKPVATAYIEATAIEPASGVAAAQIPASEESLMPAEQTADESAVADISVTDPILRLTPDKTEMIKLESDAQSIVVGNPAHASVLMENPRLLLVVPRQAGATYVSVLDKDGQVIMQRHIVVAAPKEKYVRIRRSCANASGGGRSTGCQPLTVYYCPDTCHEVSPDANTAGSRR